MKRAFVHGTILTCDEQFTVHADGVMAVDGADIVSVGERLPERFEPDETVDCHGLILMPGLVNAHVHLGEHLFRGWMDEVPFEGLFYSTLFRWEGRLTADDLRCGARAALAEAAKCGVTTVADMYHHAPSTAQALSEVGLRGLVGQKILGFSLERPPVATDRGVDYRFDTGSFMQQLEQAEGFANEWHGRADGRVSAALCPHATNTLTADMLKEVGQRAQRLHLPVHMHLAQMASELETVHERDGMGCVELLASCGLLDGPFLGAHGIFVGPEEVRLLAKPYASIIHNPIANAKDAGLIAPIDAYRNAGVRIALGTDAFRMDLLEAARFAACIQRTTVRSGAAFPARDVLRWATLDGARALGLGERTGSLEAGKAADVILLDGAGVESLSVGDAHTRALYYGSPAGVRRVYVDGRLVVNNGEILTVNETDVRQEFEKRVLELWHQERGASG